MFFGRRWRRGRCAGVEFVIGEAEKSAAFESGPDVALDPSAFLWREEKFPVKIQPDMDEYST